MNQKRVRNSTHQGAKKPVKVTSGKQKKSTLDAKREAKRDKAEKEKAAQEHAQQLVKDRAHRKILAEKRREGVDVEFEKLKPISRDRAYWDGTPAFMDRGYYVDIPFVCKFCGADVIFTPEWQKWWYETVKADVWTRFDRCEACQLKLNAAKEAKQQEDARRAAKNKIRKLRAAGKLTPKLEKELLAAARKGAT